MCGRLRTRVHCPDCGSCYIQGYVRREVVNRGNGVQVRLKSYHCRHCGELFNEDDWQLRCHAPAMKPIGRPRKLTVKVDTIEERAQLLEHLREIQKLRDLSDR